jgi:hypothetical protein
MQTPHLTPHERSILRATGFPIPAQDCPAPAAQEALDLALRSLEAPSPRLAQAARSALFFVARAAAPSLALPPSTPPDALRRACYLLESSEEEDGVGATDLSHRKTLLRLLQGAISNFDFQPIPLSLGMSVGLFKHLIQNSTLIQSKWHVYGRPNQPSPQHKERMRVAG